MKDGSLHGQLLERPNHPGVTVSRTVSIGRRSGETLTIGHVDCSFSGVHAGHLCYANLYSGGILLRDNKTGVSDLTIRARRQPYLDRKEPLPADLEAILKTKEKSVPWTSDDEWHDLTLRSKMTRCA